MKTLILLYVVFAAGLISGVAIQYSRSKTTILNLTLSPVNLLQNGAPTILRFNDEVVLEPGGQIEIMEVN